MRQGVPTLYGVVKSPLVALDAILAYYFKTLKSQSKIHYNQTYSFIDDVKRGGNPTGIEDNISGSLNSLLQPYFDQFQVRVACTIGADSMYTLTVYFEITDNGRTINIGKLMQTTNSRLVSVQNISQNGDSI